MITILIPVYNRVSELNNLLNSFVDEYNSFKIEFEVVVIDDESNDGSYEIAESFSNKYDFIKLVTSGYKSPGMSRNIGARVAKYDWLFFCDSDNLMISEWSLILSNIIPRFSDFEGIWFPARCNGLVLTSSKYLNRGNHQIESFFYFNNYIGEVVHCVKRQFLIKNNYFYLKGTTNDFPDLLWFSLFSDKQYKVVFINLVIQEYFMNSSNRISTDSSIEKNYSQIIHYKLVLKKLIKTKYIFSLYFPKILFKLIFFIFVVDDRVISLKSQIGPFRLISRISFRIGIGALLLKKLNLKRNENAIY